MTKICDELTETIDTQTLSPYNIPKINVEAFKMNFNITDSDSTGIFAILVGWGKVDLILSIGATILTTLVQIVLAMAVYRDAKRLQTLTFLDPVLWCVATLVGGVITAGIYWTIHHSRLNPAIAAGSTDNNE